MRKTLDYIKDILYDSIDYIIMIGIIGVVVLVIGWRLDLLFANDALDIPANIVIENNNPNKDKTPPIEVKDPDEEIDTTDPLEEVDAEPIEIIDPVKPPSKVVKIYIPDGSLAHNIGKILEENGLISSTKTFLDKSQELKLDTKLKSGNFEIDSGLTIEAIIKLIAK